MTEQIKPTQPEILIISNPESAEAVQSLTGTVQRMLDSNPNTQTSPSDARTLHLDDIKGGKWSIFENQREEGNSYSVHLSIPARPRDRLSKIPYVRFDWRDGSEVVTKREPLRTWNGWNQVRTRDTKMDLKPTEALDHRLEVAEKRSDTRRVRVARTIGRIAGRKTGFHE